MSPLRMISVGNSRINYTTQDEQYASGYTSTNFLTKCGLAFENL